MNFLKKVFGSAKPALIEFLVGGAKALVDQSIPQIEGLTKEQFLLLKSLPEDSLMVLERAGLVRLKDILYIREMKSCSVILDKKS